MRSEIKMPCDNIFLFLRLALRLKHKNILLAAMFSAALVVLGSASSVSAWVAPVPEALLTTVEGALVPDSLGFQIDQPVANCPANVWLTYDGGSGFPRASADESMRRTNVRSIFQMLMAQKIAGAKIRVYAGNSTTIVNSLYTNCRVEFIHAI
jgi:hypothetical protein